MILFLAVFSGCDDATTAADALSVRVLSPLDADTTGSEATLIGLVEGGGDGTAVWWESSLDGTLDEGVVPDEDGICYSLVGLSPGAHELWLYAEDGDQQAFDSVSITVGAGGGDTIPEEEDGLTVSILAPEHGSTFEEDDKIVLRGQVMDTDGAASVTWTSSRDGTLKVDGATDDDGVSEGAAVLSVGTHTVTLSATEGGNSGEDSISVTISAYNTAPEIAISLPGAGSTFDVGDQVYLKASVSDTEDDPEDLEVSWSSNLDGVLTTEYAEEDGTARSNAPLSAGEHTLTATVTDSGGKQAEDLTTVTVK